MTNDLRNDSTKVLFVAFVHLNLINCTRPDIDTTYMVLLRETRKQRFPNNSLFLGREYWTNLE